MVDAITAVSASSATSPTKVESSLSITSEPDNKYVAARQSQIEAGLVALSDARINEDKDQKSEAEVEEEFPMLFEGHERKKKRVITALGLESTGARKAALCPERVNASGPRTSMTTRLLADASPSFDLLRIPVPHGLRSSR